MVTAPSRADANGIEYVVNDISSEELELAPSWVKKTCFDIGTPDTTDEQKGRFGLVFSKTVLEHVRDTRQAYQNIYEML